MTAAVAALLASRSSSAGGVRPDPPPPAAQAAILQRLAQARDADARAVATLAPVERELVFLADFEQDDAVFLGGGVVEKLDFENGHYRAGKNGRGFFFEKPQGNLLPAELADVETRLDGFQPLGAAALESVAADTPWGKRALLARLPGNGAGFRMPAADVAWHSRSWHEKVWSLLASCHVKGPRGARLTIDVRFEPASTNEPAFVPDRQEPQSVLLTGDWQRIACSAAADVRPRERRAVFSLRSDAPVDGLLVDGFQWEQAGYYPHGHSMPTTWTPGGTREPATSVRIGSPLREEFPLAEGTLAFWTLTPRTSNLPHPGNSCWLSFGAGYGPGWKITPGRCDTPGGGIPSARALRPVYDGSNWHHVAMSWGLTNVALYVDGQPAGSATRVPSADAAQAETFSMVLGGSYSDGQTANSVLDDVAVFKRQLTAGEVGAVAAGPALRAAAGPLLFSRCARTVYYRAEEQAGLEISLLSTETTSRVLNVDCAIGGLLFDSREVTVRPGLTTVRFPFAPSRLKCGAYVVQAGALVGAGGVYGECRIEVVPALRRDHYMFSTWGGGGDTAAWRAFCRGLGLNTIDTYAENFEQLGREGFLYNWHYNCGDGIGSERNREAVRAQTRLAAGRRAPHPNWRSALVNSEVSVSKFPDGAQRAAWFDAWAEKELGFPVPTNGWRLGTSHNPVSGWFAEGERPETNGVYQGSRNFGFLSWWYNRGAGWWRLNAEAAAEIRRLRPDVLCWTDPVTYPGQIADLDAGSTWSYQLRAEPLIGDFETSYAAVRGSGKEYYATLGMNYVKRLAENVRLPDGTTNNLAPTADDMIQQAWLAVAQIPTDGLTYWSMNSLFDGLQKTNRWYAEPGSGAKLGAVLKNDLLPVGTLLKQVPNAQRPLALLLPESTQWMCAGEGGWHWGTAHYPDAWKNWVGALGLPYDVLLDHDITPGALAKYRAVIFPMAEFVTAKNHRELLAAAQAGTVVVVDSYCRQAYPGMIRLEQTYYHRTRDKTAYAAQVEATEKGLAQLRERLLPHLDAYAVGEAGPVIVNIREAEGVKYVSVINDRRQEGPYSQWTTNTFKPYGSAQRARVSLRLPEGSAVYELTQSTRLPLKREGDRWLATIDLPPHAGRLLCLYPAPVQQLSVEVDGRCAAGSARAIRVAVLDNRKRQMPGRQVLQVEILDPDGRRHDESGLYRAVRGEASIPFRPALNDPAGTWRINVTEKASGLRKSARVRVVGRL